MDQVRTIIKKFWFYDQEILKIHQQINRESNQQHPNTIINKLDTEKQEPSNLTKPQNNSNRNITHPNHIEQRLTQEEKNEYKNF